MPRRSAAPGASREDILMRPLNLFERAALGGMCVVMTAGSLAAQPGGAGAAAGDYLGMPSPGSEPAVFAPGVVSTGLGERDMAITPDGNEIYYTTYVGRYVFSAIMMVRRVGGSWQSPEVAPFSGLPGVLDGEPAISPDGKRFFFLSNRPSRPGAEPNEDIWVMERTADGWGAPANLGAPVNSAAKEYFPSLTRDGTLYFTREGDPNNPNGIYRARLLDGKYAEIERLPDIVNAGKECFNAFIAPDESFLIYSIYGRKDSVGSVDYYVSFRSPDDAWSEPINLGPKVNTKGGEEYAPYVSLDGRYFFFMSSRTQAAKELFGERVTAAALQRLATLPGNGAADVWWVDASFLQRLKPKPTP